MDNKWSNFWRFADIIECHKKPYIMKKSLTFLVMSLFIIIMIPVGKATLKDGLVSYYSFNTATPTDTIGAFDGTSTNIIFNSTEYKGGTGSFHFDGTSKVQINDSTGTTFANFSYSLWFKEQCAGICALYSNGQESGVSENFGWIRPSTTLVIQSIDIAGTEMSGHYGYFPSLFDGNWHYIVFTHNGTGQATYADGIMVLTSAFVGNIYNGNPRYIGYHENNNYPYYGFLDEVALYNRSLTSLEVTELYNNGTGLFYPFGSEPAYTTFSSQAVNNTNPAAYEDVLFSISVTNLYGINESLFSYYNGTEWVNESHNYYNDTLCYQESAMVSNQTGIDGDCGLLYTGNYSVDGAWSVSPTLIYDGDWYTGGGASSGTARLWINYSIPIGATGALWQIFSDNNYHNVTIPDVCFVNKTTLSLEIQSVSGTQNVYAYCSSDFALGYDTYLESTVASTGSGWQEEAIYWIVPQTKTELNLNVVKTMPDSLTFNYTWQILNSSGYWLNAGEFYLNVTPIPLIFINYTPVSNETKIFVPPLNTTQTYNATVNKEGWASWLLDGVIQFFQVIGSSLKTSWTWIVTPSEVGNARNVTVIINDSTGQIITHNWQVNVTLYATTLSVSPNNVSAQYSTINISCQVPSDNATVIISYSLPSSSSWVNLTTIYNSETGYFDSSVITQLSLSWIGTLDFRCIGYDFLNNVTIEQYAYDAVNVYLPSYVPPTLPTSTTLINGIYDASITLQCDGAESLSGYLLYYDFKATYNDTNGNLQTEQLIMENLSSSEFKWYLLNFPEQQEVSVSCRAFDGITYSNWLNLADNITIAHGLNLNMFYASIHRQYFVNSKIILAEYCNIGSIENTKIFATWADCNEDNQWDYVNMYNSTEKNYTSVYDYFSCIYPNAGVYNVIIGCVTERKDPSIDWNRKLCLEIAADEQLCNFQKAFSVTVDDVIMPEVRK
jgi:hypothetical protein